MKNFLFEILVQEMPYKFISSGLEQLKNAFIALFNDNNIGYEDITGYATPRRLAVLITGLIESQEDETKDIPKGLQLRTYIYDYSSVESLEELKKETFKKYKKNQGGIE